MENKIITEEDFWECSGGLMPVPLQSSQRLVYTNGRKAKKYITVADKSTVSWADFGCKKLMLLYAVVAAAAAAVAALCAATGGAALIAVCALAGAAGAAWGAVVGCLLCGQMAAMARVWLTSKDDFKISEKNTIRGKDKMECLAFTFIGQNPETITYNSNIKSWSQAIARGAANVIEKIFEGMMYGACIGGVAAAGAALAGGASTGGLAGMGRVVLNFIKSMPRNFIVNIVEGYSGIGMGMRTVMSGQSALATYGELGDEMTREDLGNAVSRGFWSMETGTYESGKNILTGNGKPEDYMGLALSVAPTGQGVREVFPHDAKYQNMGIVPDNIAGKMDLDGGIKKAPDADGGVKKSVADDGLPVKKQGNPSSKKAKSKNGKAFEKGGTTKQKIQKSLEAYARLQEKMKQVKSKTAQKKTYSCDGGTWCSGFSFKRISAKLRKLLGITDVSPNEVMKQGEHYGHEMHQNSSIDNGVKGSSSASHAEKQGMASTDDPLAVSKKMCPCCESYAQHKAKTTGEPVVITDPEGTKIFYPDGTKKEISLPEHLK